MFTYSMTQWIAGDEDIECSFKRLQKYAYDGIELAAEPYTLHSEKMVALMKKYNLCCTSLCGIFSANRNLSDAHGERAIQYLKDSVDFAKAVGAPYIIVVPSPVGCTVLQDMTYAEAWHHAVCNIRIAAEYAESQGVKFAIEAINRYETYLVNTLSQALQLVEEINHPAVGVMADLFHMSIEENNIGASLRKVAKHLMHVHIADNTRESAGLGSIDFKSLLYVLKDIEYQGPLTMEFLPRVANPYQVTDTKTHSELMDSFAEQAIHFMKMIEKSIV